MPRVDQALSSLVSSFLPVLPGEDDTSADLRLKEAVELANKVLNK